MKKKLAFMLALFMFSVVFLTACGGDPTVAKSSPSAAAGEESKAPATDAPSAAPTEDAPAKTDVTLRTVSMFGGTDPHAKTYQEFGEAFTKATGVKTEDESDSADETWKARVINDFNADNEPDVLFYFAGADGEPLVTSGKVIDIATIVAEYPEYAKGITPIAMDAVKAADSKNYCVPIKGFWEGLFVNTKIFNDNKLELPTDWAKFETAIKTLSKTDIVPISVALGNIPHYWIEHLILSSGGVADHKVNPKTQEELPASWATGVNMFKTLYDMGAFPKDTNATTNEMTSQLFKEGKAAMIIDGSWFIGQIATEDATGKLALQSDVTVMPVPVMPEGKMNSTDLIAGFSSGFYITKKAWDDPAKREAAVKFVMQHTSGEAIAKYCAPELGGVPATTLPEGSKMAPLAQTGLDMLNKASASDMPIDSRMGKDAWTHFTQNVPKVATGAMTAENLLKEVIEKNK